VDEEEIQEVESELRPYVLERAGGTRIYLTPDELWQRWEESECQPSDRVVDRRNGKQFPAVTLKLLVGLGGAIHHWDLFS
jgi:hypothetical protein